MLNEILNVMKISDSLAKVATYVCMCKTIQEYENLSEAIFEIHSTFTIRSIPFQLLVMNRKLI